MKRLGVPIDVSVLGAGADDDFGGRVGAVAVQLENERPDGGDVVQGHGVAAVRQLLLDLGEEGMGLFLGREH